MFCSDGEGLEDNEFRKNDKNLNKATTAERERERGERDTERETHTERETEIGRASCRERVSSPV